MRSFFIVMVLLSCLSSCDWSHDARTHPIIEDVADAVMLPSAGIPPAHRLQAGAEQLEDAPRILIIGSGSGDPLTVLPDPVDVATDGDGNVLILDRMIDELRLFSPKGAPIGVVAGRGGGPMEFRSGTGISFLSPDTLMLTTRAGIKFFRRTKTSYEYAGTTAPTEGVPNARATCGTTTYTAYRNPFPAEGERPVRIVAKDRASMSVGTPYRHGGIIARQDMSSGPIACTDSAVFVAYSHLPFVERFDRTGRRRWRAQIKSFRPLRFEEKSNESGQTTFTMSPTHGGQLVLAVVPWGASYLIVQVVTLEPKLGTPGVQTIVRRDTFLLDAETGSGVAVRAKFAHAVRVDSKGLLWTVDADSADNPIVVSYRVGRKE